MRAVRTWRRSSRSARQTVAGLLMLPLSTLPLAAYLEGTQEGRLIVSRVERLLADPSLPVLSQDDARLASQALGDRAGAAAVLVYHGVGRGGAEEGMYTVSPEHFAEQMAALRAAGANVITVSELVDAWEHQQVLPPRTTVITFDDGRAEAMMWADPVLQDAGYAATMFVIGGAAEEPGVFFATEDQLRSYAGSGRWDLQAHTYGSHVMQATDQGELPALTSLRPGESIEAFRRRISHDLDEADRVVRALSGRDPVGFAYPFGAHGTERVNDPRVEGVLRSELAARYPVAFHQDEQDSVAAATCADPRLGLRRLTVPDLGTREFLAELRALWERTDVPPRCAGRRADGRAAAVDRRRAESSSGSTTVPDPTARLVAAEVAERDVRAGVVDGGAPAGELLATAAGSSSSSLQGVATVQPAAGSGARTAPGGGAGPPATTAPPAPPSVPPGATPPRSVTTTTAPPAPATTTTTVRPTTTTTAPPRPTTTTTTTPRPPPPTTPPTTTPPPTTTTTAPCSRGNGNARKPC